MVTSDMVTFIPAPVDVTHSLSVLSRLQLFNVNIFTARLNFFTPASADQSSTLLIPRNRSLAFLLIGFAPNVIFCILLQLITVREVS